MPKKASKRGRPRRSPGRKSLLRVMDGETMTPRHRRRQGTVNSTMTNAEVRKSKRFRAYDRLLTLAEEIDRELALAVAAEPQDPAKIHALWGHLLDALKAAIPYEKPRLTAMKVSGDKKNPLFDLSGLTDKELLALRRMLLKSKQVDDDENGED